MPRFCANLTMLYPELPLAERFDAAAKSGFCAVELLWPDEAEMTASELGNAARQAGLEFALIDTPRATTWGCGARQQDQEKFRRELAQTIEIAQAISAKHIHIMAGIASKNVTETLAENLRFACALAPDQSFIIEPISTGAIPGYGLCGFDQARSVLARADCPNAGLLLDTFHAQNMGLDPFALWGDLRDVIRHIQVAQHPDRHEPRDTETFSVTRFFATLDAAGYPGVVSGEYHPQGEALAGAGWIK